MEIRRIENKREVVDVVEVYVASDGTEFDSKDECKVYEKSALGVLLGRLHEMALTDSDEYTVYGGAGCEDNRALVICPKDEAEVDVVRQVVYMKAYNDEYKKKFSDLVKVGKVVVLTFGYDMDNCWIVDLDKVIRDATAGKFGISKVEEGK